MGNYFQRSIADEQEGNNPYRATNKYKKRIDKKQTAPYLTMLGVLWIVGKQVVFQRALALSLIAVSTYSSILSKLRTARMTVE